MIIYYCPGVHNNMLELQLEHEKLSIKPLNPWIRQNYSRLNEYDSFVYQKKINGIIRFDRLQIDLCVKCYQFSPQTFRNFEKCYC